MYRLVMQRSRHFSHNHAGTEASPATRSAPHLVHLVCQRQQQVQHLVRLAAAAWKGQGKGQALSAESK